MSMIHTETETIRSTIDFEVDYHLIGHEKYVRSIIHFPEIEKLVSCSHDGTVRVWDLLKNEQIHVFDTCKGEKSKESDVSCMIEWNKDDSVVLCCSYDAKIPIASFNIEFLHVEKTMNFHVGTADTHVVSIMKLRSTVHLLGQINFSLNDEVFLYLDTSGNFLVVNYTQSKIIKHLMNIPKVHHYTQLVDYSIFSPSQPTTIFINTGLDNLGKHPIIMVDHHKNKRIAKFRKGGHSKFVHCIDLIRSWEDESKNQLISGGGVEKKVLIWDIEKRWVVMRFRTINWVFSLLPISNQFLVIGEDLGVLECLNLKSKELLNFRKFDCNKFDKSLIHFRLKNLIPSQQLSHGNYDVRMLRFVSAGKTIRNIVVNQIVDIDTVERTSFIVDQDFIDTQIEIESGCFSKIRLKYTHVHINKFFFGF